MFHRSLESFRTNHPWDATEEHPDGLLWLMTYKEFLNLPTGIEIESVAGQKAIRGKDDVDVERYDTRFVQWGIRGTRSDDA